MRTGRDNARTRRLGDRDRDWDRDRSRNRDREYRDSRYEERGARDFGEQRYRDRSTVAYRQTARQRTNSPTPGITENYSVIGSQALYTAAGKRQRKKRRIAIGAVVAVVLVLAIVGSAFGFFANINRSLQEGVDSSLLNELSSVTAGEPFYMLLLGTDSSTDRLDDEEMAGVFRSDTIILTRVDPGAKKLTLVSIPRDTQVNLGQYGVQKINAAHAFGGPTLAVKAVEDLTGVGISHYVEIDFDGFIGLVDTLGGVEVDVPMAIDDEDAGGHVDAGLQTLDSWQALTLCRARNAYENVVGQGDLYRAANQRLVLSAIVKKVLASDPATMTAAINNCSKYVLTDMNVNDILSLAQHFRGFDSETGLYTAVFPAEPYYDEYDGIWWDLPDQEEWAKMRERMQQGQSPAAETEVDPVTGTILSQAGTPASSTSSAQKSSSSASTRHTGLVTVRNGTPYDGAGANLASSLESMGFTTDVGNADADNYQQTLLIYENASQAEEARQVVGQLGIGSAMQNDGTYVFDGDFLLIVGADYS